MSETTLIKTNGKYGWLRNAWKPKVHKATSTEWLDSDFESNHLGGHTIECQTLFYSIIKWVSWISYIITFCYDNRICETI